jgi:hypothetical protein
MTTSSCLSLCLCPSFQPLNYFFAFHEVLCELYDIEGIHKIYLSKSTWYFYINMNKLRDSTKSRVKTRKTLACTWIISRVICWVHWNILHCIRDIQNVKFVQDIDRLGRFQRCQVERELVEDCPLVSIMICGCSDVFLDSPTNIIYGVCFF